MKVGIVTVFDNNNQGNRLQNYALQQVLLRYADEVVTMKNKPWYSKKSRIARKYGIDFAPFKVKGENRYMVFFKAADTDAMTAAFKEYTNKLVKKKERPSVLKKLAHFKSLIKSATVDRTKRKELER